MCSFLLVLVPTTDKDYGYLSIIIGRFATVAYTCQGWCMIARVCTLDDREICDSSLYIYIHLPGLVHACTYMSPYNIIIKYFIIYSMHHAALAVVHKILV